MKRVLQFIEKFDKTDEFGYRPSNYYGGVFWPLYENEGAGCSAFSMSILHLAGFSMEELEKWKVEVKLPMTLIGGKLNNGKKVKFREVIETDQWYVGQGLPGKDYISFSTYDPSLLYKWINLELSKNLNDVKNKNNVSLNNMPVMEIDYSDKLISENAPIFISRPEPHIFINYFFSNRNSKK
ncbi:MAG: hypothetical protein IPH57_18785 [Saprospiraceae bacterium]|nr:hypothetical protein [Saprospiraceae bacterium]